MANTIGFDNKQSKEHRFSNTLDGNRVLSIYVDKAKGITKLFVNDSEVESANADVYSAPFYVGKIALPRGEFILSVESECDIDKILLTEDIDIETAIDFDLHYANRKDQWVFGRPKPQYTEETLNLLKRHGFLYDTIGDCAEGKMPSGIPLGGFGCGKLEICKDGMFTAFTGNNNQDSPIYRMPGSFIAVSCNGITKIFRKNTLGLPYDPIEKAESDFEYPFARLKFSDNELPVSVVCKSFSPHIANNAFDSALPVVFFDMEITNESDNDVNGKLCFSWENIINVGGSMNVTNHSDRIFPLCFHTWNGSFVWSDRRENTCKKCDNALIFEAETDCKNPMSFGSHILYCSDSEATAVCDRSIIPDDEKWFNKYLSGECELRSTSSEFRAGAWIVDFELKPNQTKTVQFILAWYMPTLLDSDGKDHGVEYTNRFDNVYEILEYALRNKSRLYNETKEINNILNSSSLPKWFKTRLLDDRFVMSTGSWFDKDGNFSINEAPTGMGGCLGTLDQRTASQCYYTSFFPELDRRELDLFRLSQADDGMCAHEIGFAGIKLWARPFSKWPDLVASYIIQVHHHYQRTGDKEMLLLHWSHIKKAIEWTLTLDDIKCGIPYISPGRGTTYDNQFWEGISSFISTMQIAAYRLASECARIVGDIKIADEWEALSQKAQKYRMEHLWNKEGGFFYNAYNPKTEKTDYSCFISSLAGEWAAMRAGIPTMLSENDIANISASIAENCVGEKGLSDQGGRKETTAGFMQYPLAYLASPAIMSGNEKTGLEVAYITEKAIDQPGISTHFDQALTYKYNGDRYGLPYYMTAPASWNILEALSGVVADCAKSVIHLSPSGTGHLKLPVFLTYTWFELERSDDEKKLTLTPIKSVKPYRFNKLIVCGKWRLDEVDGKYDNMCNTTEFEINSDLGCKCFELIRL